MINGVVFIFKSVVLFTNKLKLLKRFYMNVMELEIIYSTDEEFTIHIGTSKLTFRKSEQNAFYHFAINIPGNQFSLMKAWMKNKVTLNREGGRDEVYFSSFNADSIYFEDPAGNIIELIGRRHRDLFGHPSAASFLNISEVGIVTSAMIETGDKIQDLAKIPLRQGTEINPNSLNFLGKDETFIVLVPPERRWYFSQKYSKIYPLEITLTNEITLIVDETGHLTIKH